VDLGDLFKALIWDNLVKAAVGRLFAAVPILAWGPIGYVITWVATHFADKLYDSVKMAIALEAIAIRNEAHRRAYDRASVALKIIAQDKGINSPEFREARDANKRALAEFVRFAS
jgi:hypothetical protein